MTMIKITDESRVTTVTIVTIMVMMVTTTMVVGWNKGTIDGGYGGEMVMVMIIVVE